MIQKHIDGFWNTAAERERIRLRRLEGGKAPFTENEIFRTYRFCNTFREDDKTTVWFRQRLRGPLQHHLDEVLFATVAFRWFNRIETGERIQELLTYSTWSTSKVRELLTGVSPVVTGAYIIKTPNGKTKLEGLLECIERVRADVPHLAGRAACEEPSERLQEGVWEVLRGYPYLGSFMAYQVISDLIHTDWLRGAADRYSWAAMGPGSTRGCGWILEDRPEAYSLNSKADCVVMNHLMRELCAQGEQRWGRKWTMQEVQHWLCEYDKYTRALKGQPQKRKFS